MTRNINRREFIKQSSFTAAALAAGLRAKNVYAGGKNRSAKKVIVIGIDGMDPRLSNQLMQSGKMPNLRKLAEAGGFSPLGTSIPPQSPVAWANFINGAGPGSHGLFDFIHRDPKRQVAPFFSMSDTKPGSGYFKWGQCRLQLDFWPFNHKLPETVLLRQGTPFWDYLDKAGIESTFYDLPSNYPPSESKYGHHRCLAGMGTPDLLGTYGTYQHFAEDGPVRPKDEGGGRRSMLFFENDRATGQILGPPNSFLLEPQPVMIDFEVHRDLKADAAVIKIQGHTIVLKKGLWSRWVELDFEMEQPGLNKTVSGICRFYLQQVRDNFRLYVTPINSDPSDSTLKLTEPDDFIADMSKSLGLFYTTGFQEDHKALSNGVFSDSEYANQAGYVLKERLNLLDYALKEYDDGLLFFYFSSADLQSHMFWWNSDLEHPTRSASQAKDYFHHIQQLYGRMDQVVGDILKGYGDEALVMVMSDHGFANFKRQFNLNAWLRENDYLYPPDATSVMSDVDWAKTKAYGLGINGLYINQAGRERDGIVSVGQEKEELIHELVSKLESLTDANGRRVIHKVQRSDQVYPGDATAFAPDLIIGYSRDYRASWDTCLGDMGSEVLWDNDSAWAADHCADVSQVPGVLFCNRKIAKTDPALIDMAPTILNEFGQPIPKTMTGKPVFKT